MLAIYIIFSNGRTKVAVYPQPHRYIHIHIFGNKSSRHKFQWKQNESVAYVLSRFKMAVQSANKYTQWVIWTLIT